MNEQDLTVKGYRAAAVEAGIRKKDRLDLGLVVSDVPAMAAGVFTTSTVKAAPVLLGIERIRDGYVQAIVVNSGIANACTGEQGMRAAKQVSALVAQKLDIADEHVQVSSTGVIGMQLDVSRFAAAMDGLAAKLSPEGLPELARAMMTTDIFPKTSVRTLTLGGQEVRIAGLAKGAGMIMPDMATMLCYIMTDAAVESPHVLKTALRDGVDTSFNAITVDGDTSTNDTVLLLANGMAGNPPIALGTSEMAAFQAALNEVCLELALMIVKDGEGATKLVTVLVEGARSEDDARKAARTIANSALVKTAFFGEDANWGRIIAAVGRSGADCDPNRVEISFDDVVMVRDGLGQGADTEKLATEVLRRDRFTVRVNLNLGKGSFAMHTCDFSYEYVKVNAAYRT